jgi:hypothetical protein
MNETESTQSTTEPRKRSYVDLYRMLLGLFCLVCLLLAIHRFEIRPYLFFLGLIAFGMPFFLLEMRSWNRWFHPERVPTRWPNGSKLEQRLQTLDQTLTFILIAGIFIFWIIDKSKHDPAHILFYFIWFSSTGWGALLGKYIEDRKYIPPPRPPFDSSQRGWGIYTPLHSEHWGERVVSDTESTEG